MFISQSMLNFPNDSIYLLMSKDMMSILESGTYFNLYPKSSLFFGSRQSPCHLESRFIPGKWWRTRQKTEREFWLFYSQTKNMNTRESIPQLITGRSKSNSPIYEFYIYEHQECPQNIFSTIYEYDYIWVKSTLGSLLALS